MKLAFVQLVDIGVEGEFITADGRTSAPWRVAAGHSDCFIGSESMESTKLLISGMNCEKCVEHVTNAIRGVAGVRDVVVSLARNPALVRHDRTELATLLDAVKSVGYTASVDE